MRLHRVPESLALLLTVMSGVSGASADDQTSKTAAAGQAPTPQAQSLEEVIVTAEKKAERLQDVPVPVSVIQSQQLVSNNDIDLQSYYSKIPGLNIYIGNGDQPIVSIRGITTGGNVNPTVGSTIDDVPYASSTYAGGGLTSIDLNPADLAQVEVLRGPQGTLYGASSMGGLIRYVTTTPTLNAVSGSVASGVEAIYNSNGYGYNMSGSINVPLGSTVAILGSVYARHEPGYIDDVVHDIHGFNTIDSDGGRVSLLWQPSDNVSLKLNAIRQFRRSDGASAVDLVPTSENPTAHDLTYSYHVPQLEGSSREITLTDASLNATVGMVDIASVTSYTHSNVQLRNVATPPLFPIPDSEVMAYSGTAVFSKFTQELRATLHLTTSIDWSIGTFYAHENGNQAEIFTSADQQTGALLAPGGDQLSLFLYPTTYRELALFTTFTVKFTDRFDVQLGGREGWNRQSIDETLTVLGAPVYDLTNLDSRGSAFTYLVTPRFRVSDNLMLYARVASGYRPGSPNLGSGAGVPAQYGADTTQNYEIGAKGDIAGKLLSVDASIYRIDWKNLQIQIFDPQISPLDFVTNAGLARSQGTEVSLSSNPLPGLTLTLSGTYSAAKIESIPPTNTFGALPGDRLPYSCRFCGVFSVDYDFPLFHGLTGNLGASADYVGERLGEFLGSGVLGQQRATLPAYTEVDAHVGISSADGWNVNAFINNLADKRGVLSQNAQLPGDSLIIRPRTVGVNITRAF